MDSTSNNKKFEIPAPDAFQSGALVTDENRKIIYLNKYFSDELNWPTNVLLGKSSDDLFTRSSKIFCESYLMPLLLHEKKCEEIQLTLLDGKGKRVPIIINAKMDDQGHVYWSFFNASKRDTLYDELLEARKELEILSSTDELTGLMNRREMNNRAPELTRQTQRDEHSLTVLIIDVDYFKRINDSLGHLEGDRVLKELGKCLKKFGRRADLVVRFGGEEFLLMLPNTSVDNAVVLTRRLHRTISEIEVNGSPLTVSIGVTVSDGSLNMQDLILQADSALYHAKHNGRNRTEFYQSTDNPL